jgi:hypothetical protein
MQKFTIKFIDEEIFKKAGKLKVRRLKLSDHIFVWESYGKLGRSKLLWLSRLDKNINKKYIYDITDTSIGIVDTIYYLFYDNNKRYIVSATNDLDGDDVAEFDQVIHECRTLGLSYKQIFEIAML